jgi:hypothetical protein
MRDSEEYRSVTEQQCALEYKQAIGVTEDNVFNTFPIIFIFRLPFY